MANQTGSFNLNVSKTYTDRYTLNDGNTGTIASGATIAQTTNNPTITFSFSSSNTTETLTNSGTVNATTDRALYGSGLKSGDHISITNNAGGVILGAFKATGADGENNDAFKVKTDFSGGSITLDNSGVLVAGSYNGGTLGLASGASTSGQAIDLDDIAHSLVTITNRAGGIIAAADSDAIRPGSDAIIKNYGSIVGGHVGNSTSGNNAIALQDHTSGSVEVDNYAGGSITGDHHGVTAKFGITVNNDGTIEGKLGSGINIDSTSVADVTHVNNTGSIIGHSGGTTDGDAIDVDETIYLENSGLIQATGSAPTTGSLAEGLAIGGGTIINNVGGQIISSERAITVDNSNHGNAFAATTITNAGTITGGNGEAIKITDTFADTLTNKGTINGSVDLGDGNDTFNLFTGSSISGTVDGGAGSDTANLQGSGAGEVGGLANIEIVNLLSGTWTLDSETESQVVFKGATAVALAHNTLSDGVFDATISGFTLHDTIDLKGIGTAAHATLGAGNVLTISGGTQSISLQLNASADYSGSTFTVASDGNGGTIVENVICFYPGTRIATPTGEVPVETLRSGDLVLTTAGAVAPIRWMGRQTVSTRFADELRVLPIRLCAGALGEGLPTRDLLVSPQHALLIDGMLIQAGALVNGMTILREHDVPEIFTYWHIELTDHSLVQAEGVAAETFIDNVDRMAFDNWAEHDAADTPPPIAEMTYPRAKSARQVPQAIRRRLAALCAAHENVKVA